MKLLLDTHLLLWAAEDYGLLPRAAQQLMSDSENDLLFSSISIWEVAVKRGLGRPDFRTRPQVLRLGLVENGYAELSFTSEHAFAVEALPNVHKDPFDRALIAQAMSEGILLLTADRLLDGYSGVVRKVWE